MWVQFGPMRVRNNKKTNKNCNVRHCLTLLLLFSGRWKMTLWKGAIINVCVYTAVNQNEWKVSFTGKITQAKVSMFCLSPRICTKHGYSFALCALLGVLIHGALRSCPVVCVIVCFCLCLPVPLCSIGKLFLLVFGVCMTVSFFVCVPMCGWSWTNKASFLFDCVHSVKHSVCN